MLGRVTLETHPGLISYCITFEQIVQIDVVQGCADTQTSLATLCGTSHNFTAQRR